MNLDDNTDEENSTAESDSSKLQEKWLNMQEACEYLQVSEQTMFRWMRAGKVSFYKVGKATRFKAEDLDRVVEKVVSKGESEQAGRKCAVCGHARLVEGRAVSTGNLYFKPEKAKFWVWAECTVPTKAY